MSGVTKLMTPGGGGVALTPASSIASDVTVNVPSQSCTLGIQGPAFSAYANAAPTLANATWTKLSFNTKEFDTASCYDNVTNYRFTPNVAGYYQISGGANINGAAGQFITTIYKNGSEIKRGNQIGPNSPGGNALPVVSALIYMNGSTDYVELYGYQSSGSSQTLANPLAVSSYFQGALVRAA